MKPFNKLSLVIQLSCVAYSFAQTTAQVTIPVVAPNESDVDFSNYDARILGSTGEDTTYALNCPAATPSCIGEGITLTVISGPSTYELLLSEDVAYSQTACVLTGSPTPTTGSCELTWTGHIRTWTQSSQITFQLPETESLFLGIYPATLEVVGSGTAAPTTTTAPPKTTSGTGGTASVAPTATTTQSTSIGGTSSIPATTSGATRNAARRTAVPLILLGGAIAAANAAAL